MYRLCLQEISQETQLRLRLYVYRTYWYMCTGACVPVCRYMCTSTYRYMCTGACVPVRRYMCNSTLYQHMCTEHLWYVCQYTRTSICVTSAYVPVRCYMCTIHYKGTSEFSEFHLARHISTEWYSSVSLMIHL